MSLDHLLESRRSIRKYKSDPVPDHHVRAMIKSAMLHPSPSNSQPVRYLKIASKPLRQALKNEMTRNRNRLLDRASTCAKPGKTRTIINHFFRYSAFMFETPLLFAVGTLKNSPSPRKRLIETGIIENERETMDGDITLGLSLAAFMLKAGELGLGTCILTAPFIFINPGSIPWADGQVRCFLTTGFPDEQPDPSPKKPLDDILLEL